MTKFVSKHKAQIQLGLEVHQLERCLLVVYEMTTATMTKNHEVIPENMHMTYVARDTSWATFLTKAEAVYKRYLKWFYVDVFDPDAARLAIADLTTVLPVGTMVSVDGVEGDRYVVGSRVKRQTTKDTTPHNQYAVTDLAGMVMRNQGSDYVSHWYDRHLVAMA